MDIVILDRNTIGEDIDISIFSKLGKLTVYPFTEDHNVANNIISSDIVIANKSKLSALALRGSKVRLICLTATGTDNVDIDYCSQNGIAVCNIKGYSTESVVQHTFTMLLSLSENMYRYQEYTRSGGFIEDASFRHLAWRFHEISGLRFGIIGLGAIGKRVSEVAGAFGCEVCYWSSNGVDRSESLKRLELNELIETCDILSIHSPLTPATHHLIGLEQFKKMKKTALIVNVGRGNILVEEDLVKAIETNLIGGAAVDVLSKEPMQPDSPFIRILDNPRFLVTPHIAWAAVEARERCIQEVYLNIESFLADGKRNRVDTFTSE